MITICIDTRWENRTTCIFTNFITDNFGYLCSSTVIHKFHLLIKVLFQIQKETESLAAFSNGVRAISLKTSPRVIWRSFLKARSVHNCSLTGLQKGSTFAICNCTAFIMCKQKCIKCPSIFLFISNRCDRLQKHFQIFNCDFNFHTKSLLVPIF